MILSALQHKFSFIEAERKVALDLHQLPVIPGKRKFSSTSVIPGKRKFSSTSTQFAFKVGIFFYC